jgi:nucleotide-binding universal stress UspA family protein
VRNKRLDPSLNAVIYATDFSLGSQNAGFFAAFLAKHFSAKLFVVHAFILSQAAMEVEADRFRVSEQRKRLQSLLARKASELASEMIEAAPVLLNGAPKTRVPELADDHAPSMIVLGTHGGSWLEHELIGSVAEEILRSTPWPCFTVGPRVPSASRGVPPIRRILYATDFTPAAAHASLYAFSFAEACDAGIDIVNVIQPGAASHPDRLAELTRHFRHSLERLIPEKAREYCDPKTFVEIGKAHHQILQHIRERSIDVLVLGIRKTSHLGLQMRTSRAFQLIAGAPCPVLTVTGEDGGGRRLGKNVPAAGEA